MSIVLMSKLSKSLTDRMSENIDQACKAFDNPRKDPTVPISDLSLVIQDLEPYIKHYRTAMHLKYILKMLEPVVETSKDETVASQFCQILEVCYSKTDCFPQALEQLHVHRLLHQIQVQNKWNLILTHLLPSKEDLQEIKRNKEMIDTWQKICRIVHPKDRIAPFQVDMHEYNLTYKSLLCSDDSDDESSSSASKLKSAPPLFTILKFIIYSFESWTTSLYITDDISLKKLNLWQGINKIFNFEQKLDSSMRVEQESLIFYGISPRFLHSLNVWTSDEKIQMPYIVISFMYEFNSLKSLMLAEFDQGHYQEKTIELLIQSISRKILVKCDPATGKPHDAEFTIVKQFLIQQLKILNHATDMAKEKMQNVVLHAFNQLITNLSGIDVSLQFSLRSLSVGFSHPEKDELFLEQSAVTKVISEIMEMLYLTNLPWDPEYDAILQKPKPFHLNFYENRANLDNINWNEQKIKFDLTEDEDDEVEEYDDEDEDKYKTKKEDEEINKALEMLEAEAEGIEEAEKADPSKIINEEEKAKRRKKIEEAEEQFYKISGIEGAEEADPKEKPPDEDEDTKFETLTTALSEKTNVPNWLKTVNIEESEMDNYPGHYQQKVCASAKILFEFLQKHNAALMKPDSNRGYNRIFVIAKKLKELNENDSEEVSKPFEDAMQNFLFEHAQAFGYGEPIYVITQIHYYESLASYLENALVVYCLQMYIQQLYAKLVAAS